MYRGAAGGGNGGGAVDGRKRDREEGPAGGGWRPNEGLVRSFVRSRERVMSEREREDLVVRNVPAGIWNEGEGGRGKGMTRERGKRDERRREQETGGRLRYRRWLRLDYTEYFFSPTLYLGSFDEKTSRESFD